MSMSIPKFNGDRTKWAAFARGMKNVWTLRKVSGVVHGTELLPPTLINNGSVAPLEYFKLEDSRIVAQNLWRERDASARAAIEMNLDDSVQKLWEFKSDTMTCHQVFTEMKLKYGGAHDELARRHVLRLSR
jgi:hypothetical protein